jgi:membrane glycosyltransferase
VHPIAERFHYSLERLDIDDFNQNFLAVFLGQLSDPIGKKKVILLQILRIFIEVLVIPLVLQLQTQLVCDAITVKSSSQKTRDQGNDFEGDRFHRFLLYDNLGHR